MRKYPFPTSKVGWLCNHDAPFTVGTPRRTVRGRNVIWQEIAIRKLHGADSYVQRSPQPYKRGVHQRKVKTVGWLEAILSGKAIRHMLFHSELGLRDTCQKTSTTLKGLQVEGIVGVSRAIDIRYVRRALCTPLHHCGIT